MPDFPTHFIRSERVRQPRLPVPPSDWRAACAAALAGMTEEGQENALKEWAKLDPPFCPPLPGAPPPREASAHTPALPPAPTLFPDSNGPPHPPQR